MEKQLQTFCLFLLTATTWNKENFRETGKAFGTELPESVRASLLSCPGSQTC